MTDCIIPEMTAGVFVYDSDTTFNEGCVFANVAPCQRVKFCVSLDKTDYTTQITTLGGTGSFDTALGLTQVFIGDTRPLPTEPIYGFGTAIPYTTEVGIDINRYCTTIRIEEDWIGQTKYLYFKWIFTYTDSNGDTITDEVTKIMAFTVSDYTTTDIELVSLQDESGAELDPEAICDEYQGKVTATFKNNLPNTYSLTTFLHENGAVTENNTTANNQLSPNNSEVITAVSVDDGIANGDTFEVCLDGSAFSIGECNLKVMLAQETPSPAEIDCECLTLTAQQVTPTFGGNQTLVGLNWALSGVASANISNVAINIVGITNIISVDFPSGNTNFTQPSATINTQDYVMTVNTTDGCVYTFEFTLNTSAAQPQDLITIEDCNVPCAVTITESQITCDYSLGVQNFDIVYLDDSCATDFEWEYLVSNNCGLPDVIVDDPFSAGTGNCLQMCYQFFNFAPFLQPNGFVNHMIIYAYDGATGAVVDGHTINMSSLIVPAAGACDPTYLANLQTLIETQISAWNIPNYGTGATNGVDYDLSFVCSAAILRICFDTKNNPAGLWIGIDNTQPSSSYQNTSGNLATGQLIDLNYSVQSLGFGSGFSFLCGNFTTQFSYTYQVNTGSNFYDINTTTILLSAVPTPTSVSCLTTTLTADITGCNGGTPTYLWNTGETTQTILAPNVGTYTVTVTCGSCVETQTITI